MCSHYSYSEPNFLFLEPVKKRGRIRKYFEADGGWKCQGCLQLFSQQGQIKKHAQTCVNLESTDPVKSFHCGVCLSEYQGVDLLRIHLLNSQVTKKIKINNWSSLKIGAVVGSKQS